MAIPVSQMLSFVKCTTTLLKRRTNQIQSKNNKKTGRTPRAEKLCYLCIVSNTYKLGHTCFG